MANMLLPEFSVLTDLSSVNWDDVLHDLKELTRLCQEEENRIILNTDNFQRLGKILETLMDSGSMCAEIFVEAYRFLRNCLVSSKKNQDALRESSIFKVTQRFLRSLSCHTSRDDELDVNVESSKVGDLKYEDYLVAVRCSLQFLANSMVDNTENTTEVITLFLEDLVMTLGAFHMDEKVIQYVAMIIHLSLKLSRNFLVPYKMIQCFLQNLHLEFVVYTIESFVVSENFVDAYETRLEPVERIRVLNFLNARPDLVQRLEDKVSLAITTVKGHFIERSDFILRSKLCDKDDIFSWEIAVLLETLCSFSISDKSTLLKSDQALLTTVLCLLRQVHDAGKQGPAEEKSAFFPVEELEKLTSKSTACTEMDDIRAHPTFQFKAYLIRLVANLVYRSTFNQNKVRELECLPIILDSCKLDARNPFIAQWSVFAIRNLCEGNPENQAYIREVQRTDTENLLPKLELVELTN